MQLDSTGYVEQIGYLIKKIVSFKKLDHRESGYNNSMTNINNCFQIPGKLKNVGGMNRNFIRRTNDIQSYPQFINNQSPKIISAKQIQNIFQKKRSFIFNRNPFVSPFKIDPRDTKILIEFCQIQEISCEFHLNDKRIVRRWLSQVYQVVSGDSFMRYFEGQLSMDQTKAFATKNFLMNIHNFMLKVKHSHLMQRKLQIFCFINDQSRKIIGFLKDKFPQMQQVGSNQMLTKIVAKIDYSTQIQHDLLFQNRNEEKSAPNIIIQYKSNKNYNSDIMKVLNYLLQIAKMPIKFQSFQDHQINKPGNGQNNRKVSNLKRKNTIKAIEQKQVTMYKAFEFLLQSIFMHNKYLNEFMKRQQFQINTKDDFIKAFTVENDVQKPVDFAVGQKLSNKIDQFSDQEIKTGDIKVRNTAVLRVITKWAQQLREILRQPYQKFAVNNKFISKTGEILIFTKEVRRVMLQVVEQEEQKIKEVFKSIEQIYLKNQQQIFQFQTTEFYINEYDTNVGVVAGRTQICIGRYMLLYLNQVIHSLMSVPIKTVERLHKNSEYRLGQKDRKKILSLNLVTCRLSDLLRAKCKTNENEIISIYKLIERHTIINPKVLKLIKVKDRLNTPNKDISLNFMFMNKVVCQLQLVVVASSSVVLKDKKSSFYNNFNHLLYQLQRAQFGPIAESAYIAAKYDPFISKNAIKIEDYQFINYQKPKLPKEKIVIQKENKPMNRQQSNLVTPFICQTCKRLIQADNCSFIPKLKNKGCNQCTMNAIYNQSFWTFLSVLLRKKSYTKNDLTILQKCLVLMNPSKIMTIQDAYIGYIIHKNNDSPNPLFFRSVQIDGQLHFIASQIRQQKKSIPLMTLPLRDKGAKKKSIAKLKDYYLLTFKKEYIKRKPACKQLFHDKLSQDIQIFCHCQQNKTCVLNVLQNEVFPVQMFRKIINTKAFKQKTAKQEKRVYLQQRKLDDQQILNFQTNQSAVEVQADKNMLKTPKLIQNFLCIKRVLLDDNNIKSIQGIRKIQSLQQLLVNKNHIQSLQGIQSFPNLKVLNASSNKITELPTFQNNPKIQKLGLDVNKIQKLIFSFKLPFLTYFSCLPQKNAANQVKVSQISIQQNLPALQYINIVFGDEVDLSWMKNSMVLKSVFIIQSPKALTEENLYKISQCKSIEKIQMNNCKIQTMRTINNLSRLTFLDIANNQISSIDFISQLESLVNLECSDNLIPDFPNPERFKKLKFLYMNRNKLKNVNFLQFMPQLECFQANENKQINQAQHLDFDITLKLFGWVFSAYITKKSYCLRELQLGKNCLDNINFIKRYKQMVNLQCRFNKIKSFESFQENVNLKKLDLQFNQIQRLVIYNPMPNLKIIDLHQNKIKKLQFSAYIQFLEDLSISNNLLEDLAGLQYCPNLERLNCNQNRIHELGIRQIKSNNLSYDYILKTSTTIYKSLKLLFINGNKLTSLKQLNNFINLQQIYCKGNSLGALQIDSQLKKLQIIDIRMNPSLKSIKQLNFITSLKKVLCFTNDIQILFDNLPNIQQLQMDIKKISDIQQIQGMKRLRKLDLHCSTNIAKQIKLELQKKLPKRICTNIIEYISVPPPNPKICSSCKTVFSLDPRQANYFYYWRYWHSNKDLLCRQCFQIDNEFNKAIYLNSSFKGQFNSKLLGRQTTAKMRVQYLSKQSEVENLLPYFICAFCKKQCEQTRFFCLIQGQGPKGYVDFCSQCVNNKSQEQCDQLQNGHKFDHPLLRIRHNYFHTSGRVTGYYYY